MFTVLNGDSTNTGTRRNFLLIVLAVGTFHTSGVNDPHWNCLCCL